MNKETTNRQLIDQALANLTRQEIHASAQRAKNRLTLAEQMRVNETERTIAAMCDGIGPYAANRIVYALAIFIAASNNVSRPD